MTDQTTNPDSGGEDAQLPADAADLQGERRPEAEARSPRKAEDTSEGCHELAANDRQRASDNVNDRMKAVLERSADAWASRGDMFKRLEAQREAPDHG